MEFMHIKDIQKPDYAGKKTKIRGWVYRERTSKNVRFLVMRDVTGVMQCTIKEEHPQFEESKKILIESSLELEGTVKEDKRAPGGYELAVDKINIVGLAEPFPITKDQSTEFLMDIRHLALRSRELTSILKVRSTVIGALHEYIRSQGYYEEEAPSLTGQTSETGATVFEVKYYDRKAYLTQSWQLYAENLINALEKVYAIAPSFRAEKSHTYRHLTEYWHYEVEAAWVDMKGMIKIAEGSLANCVKRVLEDNMDDLEALNLDQKSLRKIKTPFKQITYKDALKELEKVGREVPYGKDLGAPDEKELMKGYEAPLIVTNYPIEIMSFYKKEDPDNPGTAKNFNILAPSVGEIVDGSEREEDLGKIKQKLKKEGKDLSTINWYLDGRRYGAVPHSGFGLGIERTIQWLLQREHIRDVIPFPRTINRLEP